MPCMVSTKTPTRSEADVSVLDLRQGEYVFTDSEEKTRKGNQGLVAIASVRSGNIHDRGYPL
jgi:predicted amidohydrolase